jgi:DNA-binding PadR family transcriptional regulator
MAGGKTGELTTPDLVVLSLLAERAMHGYEANLELERRQARDWAAVSRPQVYYSLEKLERLRLIRVVKSDDASGGPERREFATTAKGRAALALALEREDWATGGVRPPFSIWMALSWQARPGVFEQQLERRRHFVEEELARARATLRSVREEVGHEFHEAVWVVSLVVLQFRTELRWLRQVEREAPRRGAARHVPGREG